MTTSKWLAVALISGAGVVLLIGLQTGLVLVHAWFEQPPDWAFLGFIMTATVWLLTAFQVVLRHRRWQRWPTLFIQPTLICVAGFAATGDLACFLSTRFNDGVQPLTWPVVLCASVASSLTGLWLASVAELPHILRVLRDDLLWSPERDERFFHSHNKS